MSVMRTMVVRRVLLALLTLAATAGLVRAASLATRYQTELQRLRAEWQAEQARLGLAGDAGRKKLYADYPTPEIGLCRATTVVPGATAAIQVPGRFDARTIFLMEHDQVQVTGGAVTAKGYTATVAVAAGAVPGFARLYAYAPVSGAYSRCAAVVIAPVASYTLQGANGWTITLSPEQKAFTVGEGEATLPYKASYTRAGETTPFETMTGSLQLSGQESPSDVVRFTMMAGGMGSAMAELAALQAKMADPAAFMKMPEKEREALFKKMEELGDRMGKEQEAMVADPAAMQRKQDEFGCGAINLQFSGAEITGYVSCGKQVGQLKVSGTRR